MINISQIISILCLHSTYITHGLERKENKKKIQENGALYYQLQMMSCSLTMNPAVHLPPGIFHTRRIAKVIKGKKKWWCTSSNRWMEQFQMWGKENSRQKRRSLSCQFTILFQCALERDPSIHPSRMHPVLTTESHAWSKISVWRKKGRNKMNDVGQLWDQTNTWRRFATPKTRIAGWRASDLRLLARYCEEAPASSYKVWHQDILCRLSK